MHLVSKYEKEIRIDWLKYLINLILIYNKIILSCVLLSSMIKSRKKIPNTDIKKE
jgi:hypothetical protein